MGQPQGSPGEAAHDDAGNDSTLTPFRALNRHSVRSANTSTSLPGDELLEGNDDTRDGIN